MSGLDARERFVRDLPALLAACPTGGHLAAATNDLPTGVRRVVAWDGRRLTLQLEPAVDVCWLADAWGIDRPVATSGDVHQTRWQMCSGGEVQPTPTGPILTTTTPTWGSWRVRPILTARPGGPMPRLRSGAAPAYELRDAGGEVDELELLPVEDPPGPVVVDAGGRAGTGPGVDASARRTGAGVIARLVRRVRRGS